MRSSVARRCASGCSRSATRSVQRNRLGDTSCQGVGKNARSPALTRTALSSQQPRDLDGLPLAPPRRRLTPRARNTRAIPASASSPLPCTSRNYGKGGCVRLRGIGGPSRLRLGHRLCGVEAAELLAAYLNSLQRRPAKCSLTKVSLRPTPNSTSTNTPSYPKAYPTAHKYP
jgi:hypothetical protein